MPKFIEARTRTVTLLEFHELDGDNANSAADTGRTVGSPLLLDIELGGHGPVALAPGSAIGPGYGGPVIFADDEWKLAVARNCSDPQRVTRFVLETEPMS